MTRPPQRLPEAPGLASLDSGPLTLYGAAVRRLTVRTLLSSTRTLRNLADALTRLRWRLEDQTARNRPVAAGHPSTRPALTAVPSVVDNRFDLQFTHRAGHGASEGDPDL